MQWSYILTIENLPEFVNKVKVGNKVQLGYQATI